MGKLRDGRGFTLIEVMITVAIIGILAIVVVPYFFGESRKAKAKTEVTPWFAEFSSKEEQFKIDNGAYVNVAACPGFPTANQPATIAPCQLLGPWVSLRIQPPTQTAYCSYQVQTGVGGAPGQPAGFTMASTTGSWYWILATCNMDGSSVLDSTYFTSSVDSAIQVQNEGK
jgi:prepilin-type N-terminal cleavage/methylation domain-containing protein